MRLLLDTHALIWYALNDPKLSATARAMIMDPQNDIFMSPASWWEIAIKVSLGKLMLHQPYDDFLDVCVHQYHFNVMQIEPTHTARLVTLPYPPNHKDPFDRLMVAQVLVEGMGIVSDDPQLDAYPIQRFWK